MVQVGGIAIENHTLFQKIPPPPVKMTKIHQKVQNGQKSLFWGPKWFPKCLNRGFRGGICIKKWSQNFDLDTLGTIFGPRKVIFSHFAIFGDFQYISRVGGYFFWKVYDFQSKFHPAKLYHFLNIGIPYNYSH